MIVYVAIFSILFTIILQLFWRVQLSGSRLQIANEVKENVSQATQLIKAAIREGDSIDLSGSVFAVNPGVLIINDTETLIFDTYLKDVNVGGRSVPIRTLRLTQGLASPIDITSNHVTVENYLVSNLSQSGSPGVVQIELQLANINPDNDPDFDNRLSVRTSIAIRHETQN